MTSERLTREQALLLQRYVDEEISGGEGRQAESLLDESAAARVYVSALEELATAVKMAEEQAWEQADLASPDRWLELAEASSDFSEADLDELAPLLERFYDGEVDAAEAAVVASLVDERDDVARYLSELERLSEGIRNAGVVEDVDFDGFFDELVPELDEIDAEQRAAPVAIEPFDLRRDLELLHRYHDGEIGAEDRRRVKAWIEAGDPQVDAVLGALAEIHVGVTSAVEVAREQVDFDEMEASLEARLDAVDAEQAAENVVSLADASERRQKEEPTTLWNKPIVAVAAAVALLVTGALIGPQIFDFGPQEEASMERQTIVIFDDIQSAPGSSVFLHAPQLADHELTRGAEFDFQYIEPEEGFVNGDDEGPTVLWVIDNEDENGDDDDEDDLPDELPGPI